MTGRPIWRRAAARKPEQTETFLAVCAVGKRWIGEKMNLQAVLNYGKNELLKADIPEAPVDAWELLEYVCDIDKNYYYLHLTDEVSQEHFTRYQDLIRKRAAHTPVQYLTGYAYFMGLKLMVNECVLIPRFDTEILVEQVLKLIKGNERILDMCTGSGCILLSLMHERSGISGTGADISGGALRVAEKNAENLGIHCELIQSDLFSHISGKYDIIVSNPPYIATKVIAVLDKEVKDHEPLLALDGLEDGLHFYRRIVKEAGDCLNDGGYLCFEIGFDQGEAVSGLMQEAGYRDVKIIRDLSGLDRVVIGGKQSHV